MAAATPAPSSPAPPATPRQAASSGTAAPSGTAASSDPAAPSGTAASVPARSAATAPSVEPIAFAEPATDATGISLTVLLPEKVKGGVRVTIALANTTDAPIVVDTGKLGPHDPSFNGAPVPMTMTPAKKKLMPGEGYTYQCVFTLPTMDVGQLAFGVGQVTIAGQAAGD